MSWAAQEWGTSVKATQPVSDKELKTAIHSPCRAVKDMASSPLSPRLPPRPSVSQEQEKLPGPVTHQRSSMPCLISVLCFGTETNQHFRKVNLTFPSYCEENIPGPSVLDESRPRSPVHGLCSDPPRCHNSSDDESKGFPLGHVVGTSTSPRG